MSEVTPGVEDAELEAIMAELEAQSAAYKPAEPKAKKAEETVVVEEEREESPVPPPSAFEHDDEVMYEEAEPESIEVEKPAVETAPVKASEAKTAKAVEDSAGDKLSREVIEAKVDATLLANAEKAAKKSATVTQIKADAKAASGLKYLIDVAEFNRETGVDDTQLDRCMVEQSSLRAFYGAQAAYAEGQHSTMKVKFDVLEAALYDHHRKELAADPAVKVTEKMVESGVKSDPRYLKGKLAVIEAETIASVNKALSISLGDRKDMLVQLGADRREEGKGQLRMLESKATAAGTRAFGS